MSRLVLPRATHNSTSVSRAVRRVAEVAILLAQALQACGVSVAIIAFNSEGRQALSVQRVLDFGAGHSAVLRSLHELPAVVRRIGL